MDYEAEYIDEDKYTTVTVEEMDPSREGLLKFRKAENANGSEDEQPGEPEDDDPDAAAKSKKTKSTEKKKIEKPKKKKKKFRYESKEDRKANEMKVRLSNKKKAAARRER